MERKEANQSSLLDFDTHMKEAHGFSVLELTMNLSTPSIIHPTLIWDEENVILVDTGVPGQLEDIKSAMLKAGVPFEKLTKAVLTHQDIDHIGSLRAILGASDHPIEVIAHEKDQPYIQGEKPLIKMSSERMKAMLEAMPLDQREQFEKLGGNVDKTVEDGDTLPYCGGITVIFTPGHTPGHISLYLNEWKTLIAGDAMVVTDGDLEGPRAQVTPDMESALNSLKKLTEYDIERVVCYHGGIYSNHVNERIQELIR